MMIRMSELMTDSCREGEPTPVTLSRACPLEVVMEECLIARVHCQTGM
jgi:hypothetical protein